MLRLATTGAPRRGWRLACHGVLCARLRAHKLSVSGPSPEQGILREISQLDYPTSFCFLVSNDDLEMRFWHCGWQWSNRRWECLLRGDRQQGRRSPGIDSPRCDGVSGPPEVKTLALSQAQAWRLTSGGPKCRL